MGTTAEKLNYLKETKTKIKNALETPSSIFRDYSSLIKKYIDNQPTKTVNDGVCGNAVDLPIKAINIDGNSEQETTDGRQLFDNTLKGYGRYGTIAKTIPTGVRLSVNTDVTASDDIWGIYAIMNLSDYVGKTVRMKAMIKSSSNLRGTYSIGLCNSNGTNRASKDNTSTSEKEISFVVPNLETGQEYLGVWFYANSGGTGVAGDYVDYTNVIITIDNEDMTYEPYTGGTPSPNPDYPQEITNVGENGIKIKQSGKNLFDKSAVTKGYELNSITGQLLSNNDWYTSDYIEVNNLNKIHLSSTGKTSGNGNCFYDKDKKFIKTLTGINNVSLSVPENAYYLRFNGLITQLDNDIQIEKGTEETPYEPYHESIITPINLQGNTLSKIGDVKAILKANRNGEVEIKKNIEKIVLTGEENLIDNSSTSTRKYWGIDFSNYGIYQYNDPTKVCDVLTTKFKSRPQQGAFLPGQVALATNNKHMYFVFEPDTTEEQARAILKDMPVYFRLAEPQTIKLSSISPIELWQGTNIFSLVTNLDTTFEVEYVVDKESILNEVQTAMLEAEIEI